MTSVTLKNVKIVKFLCNHFNIEDVRKINIFSISEYYALLFQER